MDDPQHDGSPPSDGSPLIDATPVNQSHLDAQIFRLPQPWSGSILFDSGYHPMVLEAKRA